MMQTSDPLLWVVCHQAVSDRFSRVTRSVLAQMRQDAEQQAWTSNRSDKAHVYWIEPAIEQLAFTSR